MFGTKTRAALCTLTVAYFVNYYYSAQVDSPVIEIKNGKVIGIIEKSRNGRNYFSYLALPYAQPPVGQLRFEPPRPFLEKWDGVRDARSFGPQCLQFDVPAGKVAGDEDCLLLNVFTPKLGDPEHPLPVIVFIHGGSFLTGSANIINPMYFMDEDVVIVTINYRLAALGFLNTGDSVVPGNMGLKDMTMSLKWIRENIAAFNGDPNEVTVAGNSAGAASVCFLMMSPLSKGLFHRAISQSGSALSHWTLNRQPKEQAERFASKLNCHRSTSQEMVDCLKNVNGFDLVDVHKEVLTMLRDLTTLFVPTIEKFQDENTFLSADPIDLLKQGKFSHVPHIAGVNKNEGLLYSAGLYRNDSLVERIRDDFNDVAGKFLDIESTESAVLKKLRAFYLGKEGNARSAEDQFQNYTNLFSDRSFFVPLETSAEYQAVHSSVYLYHYSYGRDVSLAQYILAAKGRYPIILEIAYDIICRWIQKNIFRIEISRFGSVSPPGHIDELGIFFPVLWDSNIVPGGKDFEISRDIIKLWVAFASQGDLEFRGVKWEEVKLSPVKANLIYLRLDDSPSMIESPYSSRMAFWKSLNIA